jgi:hypothetical protein
MKETELLSLKLQLQIAETRRKDYPKQRNPLPQAA